MPRKPRFFLPGVPQHVVQRGHNREAVFFDDADYLAYLNWLWEASRKFDCKVHAYCLMTNHVHLLVTPGDETALAQMMQYVGRFYVPYINRQYGKSGSLWEGRYKSSLIDAESYLLACMRYIELNPVAAGMVKHAAYYPWSSYHCNARGKPNKLIKPHRLYKALGKGEAQLQAYDALFSVHQDGLEKVATRFLDAVQTGTPVGADRFIEQIEKTLDRQVGQTRRGRPTGYRVKSLGIKADKQ